MAERPRELDQRFQMGGQFEAIIDWGVTFRAIATRRNLRLRNTHHMVNKPFILLGLAAEYRSRRRRRWCDKHCGRPSDVYDTDRRT